MTVFFVSITELSALPGNMPMFLPTARAMQAAAAGIGTWVGREPRVVRRTDITSFRGYETVVTWPIDIPKSELDTEARLADAIEELGARVRELLDNSDGGVPQDWSEPFIRPYSPAINGPMDFWSGDRASNTLTKNTARWGLNRISLPEENPYGPNNLAVQDPTAQETVTRVARDVREGVRSAGDLAREQVTKNLWIALGFGAAGVVLYTLYLSAPAIGAAASSAARRRNPVGRRPRKAPSDDWLGAFALEGAESEDWLVPAMLVLPP